MKNKYLLFLFFYAFIQINSNCYSQLRTIDSLRQILKNKSIADSTRAKTLIALAWEIKYDDVTETKKIAVEGVKLAKKTERLKDVATGLKILGIIYDETYHYKESIDYYLSAISYYNILKDTVSVSRVECNIGMLYRKMSQNREGIKYFLKCGPVFKKANFIPGINIVNQNMGICYFNLKDYDSALVFFFKALDIVETNNMYDPLIYGNIGNCYSLKNDMVKAEKYLTTCNKKFIEAGDSSSNFYFWKFNLASIYMQTNRMAEAFKMMEECKLGYKKIGLIYSEGNSNLLKNLAANYAKTKKFDLAYANMLDAFSVKDTMFNKDFAIQMNEMKEKYEADKNELSISNLNKEAQLKDAEINQQRLRQYGMAAGLLVLVILSFVLYKNFTQKKKDNKIIQHQKNVVDEKNKEITDSITYAKRIQTASLPTENYIEKTMERLKNKS